MGKKPLEKGRPESPDNQSKKHFKQGKKWPQRIWPMDSENKQKKGPKI